MDVQPSALTLVFLIDDGFWSGSPECPALEVGLCRFSMHRKISMLRNHRRSDVYIIVFFEASEIPIYPRCFPMHRRHRCPQARDTSPIISDYRGVSSLMFLPS
ncbi:hypothetical protein AVEN_35574-1 [Araneus ventricosus]|uniref:Uncharacterized protein n=1 Tax=Araneus ventricosus TaxID=182803 RepID=A0A4Y2CJ04_ARAVE|nr:hypothetical protein AVEN_35574-1 [Araneus ventricosus]